MTESSAIVEHAPFPAAAAIAVCVGLLGFASPCVLPLVPGYLSYLAALIGCDANTGSRINRRVVAGVCLFVAGFSAVYVAEGIVFGAFSQALRDHEAGLERVLGAITIVLGLVYLGMFAPLQREVRMSLPATGLIGAPILGATFGLAWTPCATPTLGAILSMSVDQTSAARGAVLLACYCCGLGAPFVLAAAGVSWFAGTVRVIRRHRRVVSLVGGLSLVLIGVGLVSGELGYWMDRLRTMTA